MAVYQILKGMHEQKEGDDVVRYYANGDGAGCYIESEKDLAKMFPNKFRVVQEIPKSANEKGTA